MPISSSPSISFSVEMTAQTHVGLVRQANEDSFRLIPELGLIIVADGMGGHAGGEVASALAIDSIEHEIRTLGDFAQQVPALALTAAIRAANDVVRAEGTQNPELQGMGSTVVSVLFVKDTAYIAHAGDSRAYRLRNGIFERLTRDHSLVEEYLAENPDAHEDDLDSSYHHLVTRAVGAAAVLDVDVTEVACSKNDILLLCSDGLSGPVDDRQMALLLNQTFGRKGSLSAMASSLIEAALNNGGPDNITVALAKVL